MGRKKGRKLSEATKLKMSLAKRGRKFTEEHRHAMSEAQKLVKKPWMSDFWKSPESENARKQLSLKTSLAYENGKKVKGGYTKWLEYNGIKVQGTYELRTCKILDRWKLTGKILKWEYSVDRHPYMWPDGTRHIYIIDFKIYVNESSWFYLEVKGKKTPVDDWKWKSVRELGFDLRVWFLKDIIREEMK